VEEKKITESIHNELSAENIGDILLVLGLLFTILTAMANFSMPDPATINTSLMGIAMVLAAMALYIKGSNSTEQGQD